MIQASLRPFLQAAWMFGGGMLGSLRDLLPIILVIAAFQLLVFRQPLENLPQVLGGLGLVVLGLTLFVFGLDMGLFPVGEQLAHAFARRGSLPWLVVFAFALGFGTTVAEPALISVAAKAGQVSGGTINPLGLRIAVALGSGIGVGYWGRPRHDPDLRRHSPAARRCSTASG